MRRNAMDIPKEGLLRESEKSEIEVLAEGLSKDEVCGYMWGCTYAEIDRAAKADFTRHYTRGRTRMKIYAVNALKQAMHGRQNLQASLAILTRFAEEFPKIADEDGNVVGKDFNFKIVVDGD
jgi:hypothetical protein